MLGDLETGTANSRETDELRSSIRASAARGMSCVSLGQYKP